MFDDRFRCEDMSRVPIDLSCGPSDIEVALTKRQPIYDNLYNLLYQLVFRSGTSSLRHRFM